MMSYADAFEDAYDVDLIAEHYDAGRNFKLASMDDFAYDLGISRNEVVDAIYEIEEVFDILLEVNSWKDVVVNQYGH